MEERVSLSGARVHHCHQLVDAFPGNVGGEEDNLISGRIERKKGLESKLWTVQYLRGSSVTGSLAN